MWKGFVWLRIGTSDGFLRKNDETSGSIRFGEFLD
jgi:hypothetical protein